MSLRRQWENAEHSAWLPSCLSGISPPTPTITSSPPTFLHSNPASQGQVHLNKTAFSNVLSFVLGTFDRC